MCIPRLVRVDDDDCDTPVRAAGYGARSRYSYGAPRSSFRSSMQRFSRPSLHRYGSGGDRTIIVDNGSGKHGTTAVKIDDEKRGTRMTVVSEGGGSHRQLRRQVSFNSNISKRTISPRRADDSSSSSDSASDSEYDSDASTSSSDSSERGYRRSRGRDRSRSGSRSRSKSKSRSRSRGGSHSRSRSRSRDRYLQYGPFGMQQPGLHSGYRQHPHVVPNQHLPVQMPVPIQGTGFVQPIARQSLLPSPPVIVPHVGQPSHMLTQDPHGVSQFYPGMNPQVPMMHQQVPMHGGMHRPMMYPMSEDMEDEG